MSGAPPPPMPSYDPVAPAAEVRQVDRNESTWGRTVDDIVRDATREAQAAEHKVDDFVRKHPHQVERAVDLSDQLREGVYDDLNSRTERANLPREQRQKAEREAKAAAERAAPRTMKKRSR